MVKICINKTSKEICVFNVDDIVKYVTGTTGLNSRDFYLEQNGKRLRSPIDHEGTVYVRICILGGKGGFGSMLRAIGAQIEKTTNREACRDLSGRRLRDINEEKRLKAWLEKQGEREREADERKKRKIEKLLSSPKHEFKDEEYEKARSKLVDKVCDAVEEGFKNASLMKADLKRKNETNISQRTLSAKKKKAGLWLDDELSDSSANSDSDESDSSESSYSKDGKTTDNFKSVNTKLLADKSSFYDESSPNSNNNTNSDFVYDSSQKQLNNK